jgi:Chromatin modification-related protein EAF7
LSVSTSVDNLVMPVPTVDVPQAPWTYDLEIALFKAIMSYRPVGIHKSMRLISILNAINAQYPAAPISLHDIKNKLNELYDIPGIEEQEDSEEASTEVGSDPAAQPLPPQQTAHTFTEFQFPFEDVVGIIEERGKGIDGDGSVPSSPEAQMSVRSGRSGRGTKRRREESAAAVSVTDAGTEEDGNTFPIHC